MASADSETPLAEAEAEQTEIVESAESEPVTTAQDPAPETEAAPPAVVEVPAHVTEAEELFKILTSATDCHSLLRKHLTQAVFDKVKEKKTSLGGTLADCIRSGE